jgi:large subunit ribosomal protein L3
MSSAILGHKLGMTRIFDEVGNHVSCTVIEAGPCVVLQKKTPAKHKYSAIQIGFGEVPGKRLSKPERGIFERLSLKPMRHLREVRLTPEQVEACKIGDPITVAVFANGDYVDVIGTSKGRGFQGVVRRYHFAGFPQTRGTHEYRRHPGSIGHRECPGKVWRGKKMPGHMGDIRVTTQNLRVVKVDAEKNLLLLRGAVPGAVGALVVVRKAVKQHVKKQVQKEVKKDANKK